MASNTPHKPFTPLQTNVIGIGYKKDSFGRKIETKKSNDALDKVKRASRPPASTTTNRNSRSRSRSKYELGAKSKERRELCSTRPLSWYWFLWRASKWEIFLDGSKHRTFQDAKKAQKKTSELKEKSGVYEFCITMPNSKKHFKVYVGHTKNMRRRHHEDYRSRGSHLLKVFEDCMRKGLIVHRRVVYTKSAEGAKELESTLLSKFNYAWNHMENGGKRVVDLVPNYLCFCFQVSVQVK